MIVLSYWACEHTFLTTFIGDLLNDAIMITDNHTCIFLLCCIPKCIIITYDKIGLFTRVGRFNGKKYSYNHIN